MKKLLNNKLLIGLGVITSSASIASIVSCSKTKNSSEGNDIPSQNPGTGDDSSKPDEPQKPVDTKKTLDELIKNHHFSYGEKEWDPLNTMNLFPNININDVIWENKKGKTIYYKVKININKGWMVSNSKYADETKEYNIKDNFYKTMDKPVDLEIVIWKDEYNKLRLEPKWDSIEYDTNRTNAALPIESSFMYASQNIHSKEIFGKIAQKVFISHSSEDGKMRLKVQDVGGFPWNEKYKHLFSTQDSPDANLVLNQNGDEINRWPTTSFYYKKFIGTISVEQDNNFSPKK